MQTKKLFFPTDFTEQSIDALGQTIQFVQGLEYDIYLFHAFSRPFSKGSNTDYQNKVDLERLEENIDNKIQDLIEKVPLLKKTNYQVVKKIGPSIETIIDTIVEVSPDLVVMGTKGASGSGEIWGTKTAKIIKSVNIPVIVIPPNTKLSSINKIGLACDYSENTTFAKLDFLIKLVDKQGMELHIITLNRQEKTMTRLEKANRDHVLELLKDNTVKTSFINHPNERKGLVDYCEEHGIGMISVLPKSYNFIERIFHDSLTMRMAFQCPIPMLVLK